MTLSLKLYKYLIVCATRVNVRALNCSLYLLPHQLPVCQLSICYDVTSCPLPFLNSIKLTHLAGAWLIQQQEEIHGVPICQISIEVARLLNRSEQWSLKK